MKTVDSRVNTYAWMKPTMISRSISPRTMGTANSPTRTLLNRKMIEKIARMAICPAVMLAARRIVRAKGLTNMLRISMGIRIGSAKTGRPGGTRFFQWPMKPWTREPARMMAEKVTMARPAVTLKLPVGVLPPSSPGIRSKIGVSPIRLQVKMKKKKAAMSGVHDAACSGPIIGTTISLWM